EVAWVLRQRIDSIVDEQLRADLIGRYSIINERCAAVFASSDLETNQHLKITQVIPNVVRERAYDRSIVRQKSLMFVGNLYHAPNVDAVSYFCREIFPLIDDDVRLVIVGRRPKHPQGVATLHDICIRQHRIRAIYDPPDLSQYYNASSIAIAPLRYGAGTCLKILEAFAYGCPVVSASIGCRGLGTTKDRHIAVADGAECFARACMELLSDQARMKTLAANAEKFVLERNNQSVVDRALERNIVAFS